MTVLRAIGASFRDPHGAVVGPFDRSVSAGEHVALDAPEPRAASIAARMFAAIVKPTTGAIYVGDYDTRLQPPQAKRRIGFVDRAGFGGDDHAFACEAAFRAEVWGLDVPVAVARARELLAALGPSNAPYARGMALALVPDVSLIVLDQPMPGIADAARTIVPALALIETRVAHTVPPLTPLAVHR